MTELNMPKLQPTTSLLALQNGHRGRIATIDGDNLLVRRMLSLGLRVGTVVNMLNHRGKGVVIQNAGTRVALGPGIAEKLLIEPIES
jgi:Fe2+ transport system protein FeoA